MKRRGQRFAPSPTMVREAYADAVNPDKTVQPVLRLRDMTPEQKAALEAQYGAKISDKPARVSHRPPAEKRTFDGKEVTDLHPKCPNKDCDHFLMLRKGKFGIFYGCMNYPTCKTLWPADDTGHPKGEPKISSKRRS